VVTKGQELAEDLRERWETSDSPVVHKIQDLNESIFGETATAVAMREIRHNDPSFSITEFILEVQEDIRPVLQAYLKGDLNTLRQRCSREVVERCQAERRALETQGIFLDNKVKTSKTSIYCHLCSFFHGFCSLLFLLTLGFTVVYWNRFCTFQMLRSRISNSWEIIP
jgi:hypothetical protein